MSIYSTNLSRIYYNNNYVDGKELSAEAKSVQKIGDIWARFLKTGSEDQKAGVSLLRRLGVAETDREAHRVLIPLMQEACKPDVVIEPDQNPDHSGIYYLSRPGTGRFAIFKAGEKRGDMELLARRIAHRMDLPYAIPGVFCSIANPPFPEKEETIVELWNGNQKIFRSDKGGVYTKMLGDNNFGLDEPYTLTGILEPYLSPQPGTEISPADFASMTAYALAIGLRDAKLDGMGVIKATPGAPGVVLYDNEDCMPKRLLPPSSPNQHVAATHLPYLTHPLANEPIPKETMNELTKKVTNFTGSLMGKVRELGQEMISFPDLAAEDLIPVEDFIVVIQKMCDLGKRISKNKEIFTFNDKEFQDLLSLLYKEWKREEYDFELENVIKVVKEFRANNLENKFQRIVKLCNLPRDKGRKELLELLDFYRTGWDQGGCPVSVEKTHKIMESTPIVHLQRTNALLSDDQLNAFIERVCGLKHFLTNGWKRHSKPVTTLDLVRYVDPLYKEHLDALENKGFNRLAPLETVGRFTPSVSVPLSPTAISRISSSPTYSNGVRADSPLTSYGAHRESDVSDHQESKRQSAFRVLSFPASSSSPELHLRPLSPVRGVGASSAPPSSPLRISPLRASPSSTGGHPKKFTFNVKTPP